MKTGKGKAFSATTKTQTVLSSSGSDQHATQPPHFSAPKSIVPSPHKSSQPYMPSVGNQELQCCQSTSKETHCALSVASDTSSLSSQSSSDEGDEGDHSNGVLERLLDIEDDKEHKENEKQEQDREKEKNRAEGEHMVFDYIDDNNDDLYDDPTWQNVPDDIGKLSVLVKTLSLIFF